MRISTNFGTLKIKIRTCKIKVMVDAGTELTEARSAFLDMHPLILNILLYSLIRFNYVYFTCYDINRKF